MQYIYFKNINVMQRCWLSVIFVLFSLYALGNEREDSVMQINNVLPNYRIDSISEVYSSALAQLVKQRHESLQRSSENVTLNAYSMHLVMPPTFYSSSVLQQFTADMTEGTTDPNLMRMYMLNDAFAKMYVNKPEIVEQTDDELLQAGTLRSDVNTTLTTDSKLSNKVVADRKSVV